MTQERFDAECHRQFDHETKLRSFQGKTLIMHTRYDSLVNVYNARKLYDWANDPKRLEVFDDGGHNSILNLNRKKYLEYVDRFMNDIL